LRTLVNVMTAVRRLGGRSPWSVPGVVVLALVLFEGCAILPSHIHNANDAAAAKTAQTEFAAYDTGAASVYQAMLTNLEKFKVEQDRVLADLANNRHRALETDFLFSLTPDEFDERRGVLVKAVGDLDKRIDGDVAEYLRRRQAAIDAKAAATSAIERLRAAEEQATKDAELWDQTIALINKGLAAEAAPGTTPVKNFDTLLTKIPHVANLTVEFRKADGTRGTTTIGEIVKQRLGAGGENATRLSTLVNASGIDATILTLGLDLAKAQRRAADVRLAQLSRRARLYEDANSAVRLAEALVADDLTTNWTGILRNDLLAHAIEGRAFLAALPGLPPGVASDGDNPEENSLRVTEQVDTMTEWLVSARRLIVADSMLTRTDRLVALAVARLNHEDSITDSRANDESWRAVMRSGLAGLVAYHNGGFTAEDAANIIRIAQAIALAFIAGGAQ
jgi:hypothetical protein